MIALTPFVTPGPAVSAATPARRVTFAQPSAANVGGLLVAGVDEPDVRLHAPVVEREEVAAGEREDGVDAVRAQHLGRGSRPPRRLACVRRQRTAVGSTRRGTASSASSHAAGFSNWGEWPASGITTSSAPGIVVRHPSRDGEERHRPARRRSRASGTRRRPARSRSSGWSRDLARHRRPHHRRQRVPLPVAELLVAGPLREQPVVRGRVERPDRVEEPLQRVLAVRRARSRAATSISSGSSPGTGPGDVSISTSASTRSGCSSDHAADDHAAHRVAEQPERGRARPRRRRRACRPRAGRASRRPGSSGASLSPWPRWSKVTTRVARRERVEVVGEILLRAAEAVHEQQRGPAPRPRRPRARPVVGRSTRMRSPCRPRPARALATRHMACRLGRLPATGPRPP